MKDRKVIISLVGVLLMVLLIISATYAYFSVTVSGNGSKSMITANTPKKHSLSVSTLYDDIHIHVDNEDMKLVNVGSYYGAVDKENRYETDLTTGTHQIIEVSSKGMENIRYSCSGDIKVTLNIDNGSMGSVLEKEDVLLYLKGLGLDEELDLSTLKINDTKTYNTSFDIDGNDSDYLSAIVELINKPSYQNYIANKMLNVSIEAENMVCHENGTYKYLVKLNKPLTEKQNGTEVNKYTVSIFYDDEGMYQKIQNIYLVDYIDTSKAIKTWELGDTDRGTKSDEVMGWLETTPNENDSYDLYIGANGPMRAPQDMSNAFQNFTNLKKISGNALDTSEVTFLSATFANCTNLVDISALSSWNTKNTIRMYRLFYNCKNLNKINVLSYWDTSKVNDMQCMFSQTAIDDLTPLSNWNVSHVAYMGGDYNAVLGMFSYTNISDLTPISKWNTSKLTAMSTMFSGTQITDISPLANWNVSKVTDMNGTFSSTPISDLTPLSNWDVSSVKSMSNLFSSTQISDLTPITNWDVSSATSMISMFYNTKINDLTPISNWKILNLTNMSGMFANTPISDLNPLANWDVSKIQNIGAFKSTAINDLTPITNWDVSSATSMVSMFQDTQISDLSPISNWNISSMVYMNNAFDNTKISNLEPIKDWNVSHVTNMAGLFESTLIDDITPIANWDVSNLTILGGNNYGGDGMFQNCKNLTKVDLSNWNVPKLANVSKFFLYSNNITEIKLPKANYNSIIDRKMYNGIFGGISSNNIIVYTESSQIDWVKARLQEALGENNNSTVVTIHS